MLDINKLVHDVRHAVDDPAGNMYDLPPWSPQIANQMAAADNLQLDDEHWEIIMFLRDRFRQQGNPGYARDVLRDLEENFCDSRGRGHLYELFPQGPVSQASRLAGLPLPAHAHDLAFGSVM